MDCPSPSLELALKLLIDVQTNKAFAHRHSILGVSEAQVYCREMDKPETQAAQRKPKKLRTADSADAQPLDVTQTQRYKDMNPEKPAEVVDISEAQDADLSQEAEEEAETAEELGNFFEAALQYEGQDADIVS